MLHIMLSFFGFTCCFLLTVVWLYDVEPLESPKGYRQHLRKDAIGKHLSIRLFNPLILYLGGANERTISLSYRIWLERKLNQAGQPFGFRAGEFVAISQIGALLGFVLGLYLGVLSSQPKVLYLFILSVLGYSLPHMQLFELAQKRSKQFDREFPYAVYLISLSMDAGLTFVQAVDRYVRLGVRKNDVVRDEFAITLAEVDLNRPLSEALFAMRQRMPSELLRSLVIAVNQADRIGNPLAQILKQQVRAIQARRIQKAEKQANEAAIKAVGPLMFTFCSVFLILLSPVILKIWNGGLF